MMVNGLLVNSQKQGILELDEKRSCKHFGDFYFSKLHKWITTCKCDITTTIETCPQNPISMPRLHES
jgi:hypothetical protein